MTDKRVRKLKAIKCTLLATTVIISGVITSKECANAVIGRLYNSTNTSGTRGSRGVTGTTGGSSSGGRLTSGGMTGQRGSLSSGIVTSGGTGGGQTTLSSGSGTPGTIYVTTTSTSSLKTVDIGGPPNDPKIIYVTSTKIKLGGSGDSSGASGSSVSYADITKGIQDITQKLRSAVSDYDKRTGSSGAGGSNVSYADITRGIQDITQKLRSAVSDYDKRTGSGGAAPQPRLDLKGLTEIIDGMNDPINRMKQRLQRTGTGSSGTGTTGSGATGTSGTSGSGSTSSGGGGDGVTPQVLQNARGALNKVKTTTGGTGKGPQVDQQELEDAIRNLKHVQTRQGGYDVDPQKQPGAHGLSPEDLLSAKGKLKPVEQTGGGTLVD